MKKIKDRAKKKSVKGVIFDEEAELVNIGNLSLFIVNLENQLLVKIYKSTIYEHELTLEVKELLAKGLLRDVAIPIYDSQLVDKTIEHLRDEVVKRFGVEIHDRIVSEIDLTFKNKKPKNL